jgi:hypothetical protein
MDMEYSDITCPVPASPSAGSQRPKTRFRARMDSLAIPETYTDILSKMENDSGVGTYSGSTCPEWQGDRTRLDGPAGAVGDEPRIGSEPRCKTRDTRAQRNAILRLQLRRRRRLGPCLNYLRPDHLAGCLESVSIVDASTRLVTGTLWAGRSRSPTEIVSCCYISSMNRWIVAAPSAYPPHGLVAPE